ncbi:MAG: class B sortase, partial [Eggerthella lenta]
GREIDIEGGRLMATAENTDTKKKKKKRGCFWRIVFWLALVVFIGSVGTLGYLFYTYWQGQNEYEEIASRAVEVPEDGQVTNLADLVVDWDALRAINPDIVAWVYMPGTIINYPVAHKDGDSEYYLHHNFSLGEGSFGAEFGSIMLSGENAGDFSDEVNILYGHHMRNGSMFACSPSSDSPSSTSIARFTHARGQLPPANVQGASCMTHASIATPNYPTDEEFTASDWLVEESIVTPDPDTTDTADATKLFGFSTIDGADNTWRYITFADVAEFVPISYVGRYHQRHGGGRRRGRRLPPMQNERRTSG